MVNVTNGPANNDNPELPTSEERHPGSSGKDSTQDWSTLHKLPNSNRFSPQARTSLKASQQEITYYLNEEAKMPRSLQECACKYAQSFYWEKEDAPPLRSELWKSGIAELVLEQGERNIRLVERAIGTQMEMGTKEQQKSLVTHFVVAPFVTWVDSNYHPLKIKW